MMGDSIVITGGLGTSKKCWKLSLPTLNWTSLLELNAARSCRHSVCGKPGLYAGRMGW